MGSGIGSLDDVYDTTVAYEKGVSGYVYLSDQDDLLNTYRDIGKSHPSSYLGY